MHQQQYVTENKETILKFTLKPSIIYMVFDSLKHLKLPISVMIPVTIPHIIFYLHESCTSEFDFTNYLFANLVVA